MPQKLIIDTDPGDDIDDVLALAFALLRPELDVRAITTVTVGAERRAQIVKKLLRTVGKEDVPVAAGHNLPLRRIDAGETQTPEFLRPDVLNHSSVVDDDERVAVDGDAAGLIVRTVEENPGEIGIVSIGPQTNVADALRRRPEIARQVRWIAFMGGEVALNRTEHNIASDVDAARIVFASGAPLFMGTWDVTRRFVLSPDDCEDIRRADTPLCRMLARCIDLWWPHKGWKPGPVMYDIAPIVWSFDRSYYETRPMNVQVETRGEFTTGMTVARGGEPNMDVTVEMQADAVKELYRNTVLPGGPA